jgi:hypothetical protein
MSGAGSAHCCAAAVATVVSSRVARMGGKGELVREEQQLHQLHPMWQDVLP